MTTVEVPYSIAAALPSLSVMDITNDVSREVAESGVGSGIAYLHAASALSLVRVQERETDFETSFVMSITDSVGRAAAIE